ANAISHKTGIARSTLSALTNNLSRMIQFETMDKLCQHLEINPKDFFEYIPLNIEFDFLLDSIEPNFWSELEGEHWGESIDSVSGSLFAKVVSLDSSVKPQDFEFDIKTAQPYKHEEIETFTEEENAVVNSQSLKIKVIDTSKESFFAFLKTI